MTHPRGWRAWALRTVLVTLLAPSLTFAVNASWTLSAPNGDWSNPANWSSNPLLPNGVDDIATFGAAPMDQFVTVDGNFTVGGLRIDRLTNLHIDSTATGTLTFSSSSGPATVDLENSNPYTIIFISAPMVLASDLQLINRAPAPIGLSGFMSGSGSLLAAGVHATITGPAFYTGTTEIAGGDLSLVGIGQIGASSGINIGNGILRLTNSLQPSSDRLGDSVPISLSGGMLLLDQGSETTGAITVASSRSDIQFRGGGDLTVASITRTPGSILSATFRSWDNYVDRSQELGTAAHLFFTNPPALTNGILPWAIVGDALATYGPNGLTQSVPNALSLASASSTSNVGLASDESLTGNKTINSLQLTQGVDVNLQGHTLAVNSGAILSAKYPNVDSEISNGTIVSGASSGELLLYSTSNTLTVSANIANGPSGPTRLVATGGPAGSQIFMGGNNTYTGDTVVNGAFLRLQSANSLPPTNVVINYGDLFFDLPQAATVTIASLTQHGHGQLGSSLQAPVTLIAASYLMEGGSIDLAFKGSGPMTKTSAEPLLFRRSMPNYSGAVDLQDGLSTFSADLAAGTGPIIIRPKAVLYLDQGNTPNAMQLAGGMLRVGSLGQLTGSIHATADSNLDTVATSPIPATVIVDSNTVLTATGQVRFSGNVQLNGTLGYGLPGTTAAPAQGKVVSGNGTLLGVLDVRNGGGISPGNSVGRFTSTAGTLGPAGVYAWEMSGVIGNPGQQYDALSVVADLTVAATAANPFKLRPQILPGAGFDPTAGYFWPVASADKVSFPAGSVAIDRSLVLAPGVFSVAPVGKNLVLRYEPATSHSEWNVDGGGDWPVSSNWIGGVPDWPTTSVGFGPVLQSQSAGHILLNGRRFASSVNFNSS
ncbi:MAG TPA: hypothetical protein VGP99_00230, partial [Tepidisphaeraceae bacterium]|nr:hypothetical protein [Tepidisphaeraceae bacterium]